MSALEGTGVSPEKVVVSALEGSVVSPEGSGVSQAGGGGVSGPPGEAGKPLVDKAGLSRRKVGGAGGTGGRMWEGGGGGRRQNEGGGDGRQNGGEGERNIGQEDELSRKDEETKTEIGENYKKIE